MSDTTATPIEHLYKSLVATNDLYKCSIGVAVVSDMKQQLSYYANRMGTGAQDFRQKEYRKGSISPIDVVDQVKIPLLVIHGHELLVEVF